MIAILEAYKSGLLHRQHWMRNAVSGVIVGIVALPLAMAFAIASGARPEQGLYTTIIAGVVVSLLGGTRLQIAGPTGAFVAILAGITAKYGVSGLQVASVMAGFMLVLMGVARMGRVMRFIPAPVIIGFTSGIGVVIFVGQWPDFLGLPRTGGEHFHEKLWQMLQVLPDLNPPTLGLSLLGLLLVVYSSRVPGMTRVPGPLTAMVLVTVLQSVLHLPGVATLGSAFGGLPQGLPVFALPDVSFSQALTLLGPAFAIAMLGSIESLLSAVVADGMAGTRHDSNQELIGQGLANIVAPLFGGFAATGAIARTATNIRNGGTGPLAGVFHAITLLAILLFMAPLASRIPLAVLAAILFVVAWNMSEARHFRRMLTTAPTADRVILVITFLLTVFADLVIAVNVGVTLAVLQFLRRMAESVSTQPMSESDLAAELSRLGLAALPPNVLVYEIDGPMFFAAIEQFEGALLHTHTDPRTLIVRLRRVPFVDATGLGAMEEVIASLGRRHVRVVLCEANERVRGKLEKAALIGADKTPCFDSFQEALQGEAGLAAAADSIH